MVLVKMSAHCNLLTNLGNARSILYVQLMIMGIPAHLYFTRFCRSQAGDIDEADRFFKTAAHMREPCKLLLADFVNDALDMDNLLLRRDILKELFALLISIESNDIVGCHSARFNLLTNLGTARFMHFYF